MALKWANPNFSPDEFRSRDPKYYYSKAKDSKWIEENVSVLTQSSVQHTEEPRGKKRARAEDFL